MAIGSPKADRLLAQLDTEQQWATSHYIGPDGRLLSGGRSALALFSQIPLTAPFVWLFRLLPGHLSLVERLYVYIAENRYKFDPNSTCGMERPEALKKE